MENDGDFSRGVGFLVKTGARLSGVRKWKDIPDVEKEILFSRLDVSRKAISQKQFPFIL